MLFGSQKILERIDASEICVIECCWNTHSVFDGVSSLCHMLVATCDLLFSNLSCLAKYFHL